uniref:Putative ezrin-radixin-moesin-binding phosphoprotein 50 n=1 Tax=Anopheles darlingi TaxID=43151 RepID=A0A2M4CRU3_ANODA
MSSKTNGTAAATVANGTPKYEARLCHVVKRADFDGYGFNLHAEKGRPGQYIGKVDDGSPAEGAGLRQGDRIIEVNGHNITTETHKKVVELIKAVPNETRLLVIDPRADANDLKMALAKASAATTTATTAVSNNNNNNNNTNGTSNGPQENGGKLHSKDTNGQKKDSIKVEAALHEEKSPKTNGTTNNNVTNNNNINSHHHQNGNGTTTVDSTTKTTTTTMDKIIDDTKKSLTVTDGTATGKMALNGTATEPAAATVTPVPAASEGKKLNLPMTAAEMRAQLAARKKYDPKNDVCDLRKKYEIIQKM